ncbi:putative bifunctional diguanylate cyclase/phosphodiesterase [Acidithiobacillus thiooxidans]|uniref:Putative signaling protein n=1 Tax=Acidithiobacillus thiooxidans ATCC 19377 TaxID=637390 RepID=A0A543Q5X5_ACITH|nr:bifunctional diguanylate cyclase/phosphodiesterase [Acidithiobacillus thiooxidans]MDX5934057.1 bifunctional diguanylate cyclase/phosphodiesterase [Acidithiobacillus thiooxidans]TQN51725.1 putative signaling protein [Acidithiobacillus thiooxidans ATCC 19377]
MNSLKTDAMNQESIISRLQHLTRIYDFGAFFEETAALAAEQLQAEGAAFIVREGNNLRYLFFHGLPSAYAELASHVFPDNQGISGRAIQLDQAVFVDNYPADSSAMPEYIATGLKASLVIPVHGPEGTNGILAISWFTANIPVITEAQLQLAQLLADMLGAAWYRMGMELHLEHIATRDALTGVPNRYQLEERLQTACARAQRDQRTLALVLLDIDGFKEVNDNLGHQAGDRLLREIVTRLQDVLRASDTIVRLAGDEFLLLLENLHSRRDLEDILQRVLIALNIRMGVDHQQIRITASAGVTTYPHDDVPVLELIHHADQAVYRAKSQGGNCWVYYDHDDDERRRAAQRLRGELERALKQKEFVLYWQPIINLHTGQCVAAEALIRWQHPERGLLLPASFMDIAENSPAMQRIGAWVTQEACRQGNKWAEQGFLLDIQINLSARQIENHRLCEELRANLNTCPALLPERVCLELVERIALRDIGKTSRLIQDCQSLGVRFALDDFGTGPAALQYLLELGCNQIKIDHTFVIPMTRSQRHQDMVRAMVQMAHALGVSVTAEGIEDEITLQLLQTSGADRGQGYHIARPMPAQEMVAYIQK